MKGNGQKKGTSSKKGTTPSSDASETTEEVEKKKSRETGGKYGDPLSRPPQKTLGRERGTKKGRKTQRKGYHGTTGKGTHFPSGGGWLEAPQAKRPFSRGQRSLLQRRISGRSKDERKS